MNSSCVLYCNFYVTSNSFSPQDSCSVVGDLNDAVVATHSPQDLVHALKIGNFKVIFTSSTVK